MKIYTKAGDKGETSLLCGVRVSKADQRVDAYGTIDEASSMLGLARSFLQGELKSTVYSIQKVLIQAAAEIASLGTEAQCSRIKSEDATGLEKLIDELNDQTPPQTSFSIPGDSTASAALDVSRTIIRRAERELVVLQSQYKVSGELLQYLNRLSDAIYMMARYLDHTTSDTNV